MAFSNVNTSENNPGTHSALLLVSEPSRQSERPWVSFGPGFYASAESRNNTHDALGDWSRENNKRKLPFTCSTVAILPYWISGLNEIPAN